MVFKRIFPACAIVLLLCFQAVAQDQAAEVEQLVNKAAQVFQEKGKDYAIKLLNASSGPFNKGEVYVFCVSLDGVSLSHPTNRDLIGKPLMDMQDSKGKLFVKEFVEVAKNPGAGWVDYWWLRHGEKEPTLKKSFIKRVPGEDVFVGAGYYVK